MKNQKLIKQLEKVIALHNKMINTYGYASPRYASNRRSYEMQNTKTTFFKYNGNSYCIYQETQCSSTRIYYKITYFINNEYVDTDIRLVYNILKELKKAN